MRHTVKIFNRKTHFETESIEHLRKFFSYKSDGYFFAPSYQSGSWDGITCLIRREMVATGLFLALRKEMETAGLRFEIEDERDTTEFTKREFHATPRSDQISCVEKMIVASNTGGLILSATGVGKTFIAALYFSKLKGSGVFIVDERTLAYQAQKEIETLLGEPVGLIGDGKYKPQRITVALAQSLQRKITQKETVAWGQQQDAVFIDEIHQNLNARTREIIGMIRPNAVFGLTATLRLKKKNIAMLAYEIAGPVLHDFQYNAALKEGVLAPGVVIGVDLLRSHPRKMDAALSYKMMIVEDEKRNDLIQQLAREGLKRGKHVTILVDRPGHVKLLSKGFEDIPHSKVYGARTVKSRLASKANFEKETRNLLIANRVFKKGINIKIIDVIIDGAGLGNEDDAVQKFGRGVRILDGKRGLIYFDIGDKRPLNAEFDSNRFSRATKRRRKALAALNVPVVRKLARSNSPAALYDYAEQLLSTVVKKSSAA